MRMKCNAFSPVISTTTIFEASKGLLFAQLAETRVRAYKWLWQVCNA